MMKKIKPVVIFGMGDFTDQVYFYFTHDSQFDIRAFTVDQAYIKKSSFHGLPVVPFETLSEKFPPTDVDVFVAVGYSNLNELRAERCRLVRAMGYKMVNYIHSTALISPDLVIGENCFIQEKVTIQPFVRLGDGVIILPDTGIGHHSSVADYCFISGCCRVAGFVTFGRCCFVSVNATFKQKVQIGRSVIIGAGALILEDAPDESAYITRGTQRSPRSSKFYRNFL